MTTLHPSIVPYVSSLFPARYRENGPLLVAFVKAYHEWLEDSSRDSPSTHYLRSFPELRDVDETTDEFLALIKEKYLVGIKYDTRSDVRLLVKHAKDLFRAKGSSRALDLFFRVLYDEVVKVYYPGNDVLVPSSGVWRRPTYLELSLSRNNFLLESKTITGLSSGAVAFVDSVVRRFVRGRIHDTAYVSAVDGDFATGEKVVPTDSSLSVGDSPTVVGSLNEVVVSATGSGSGYSVGDVYPLVSERGFLGLGRVANTVDQSSQIDLEVLDGGYGYTTSANVVVSNTVLTVSNLTVVNSYATRFFDFHEVVSQPLANISFTGANGTFEVYSTISTYDGSSALAGTGRVLSVRYSNATSGWVLVAPLSGNLVPTTNAIFSEANAIGANLDVAAGGYADRTATGVLVGTGETTVSLSAPAPFSIGDSLVQYNVSIPSDSYPRGRATVASVSGNSVTVSNVVGVITPGAIRSTLGSSSNATSVSIRAGILVTNNEFSAVGNNLFTSGSVQGTATSVSTSVSSQYAVANTMVNTETALVNTDELSSFANLSGPYGIGANTSADVNSPFSDYLTFANVTVGRITSLSPVVPGTQVDVPPIVSVVDHTTSERNLFGYRVSYTGATASFVQGEVVSQAFGSRLLIESVNSTSMDLKNLRFSYDSVPVVTSNSTTVLVGSSSGAEANLVTVDYCPMTIPEGRNALVNASSTTGDGGVSEIQVLDSGFGFLHGETVWLARADDLSYQTSDATGSANLYTMGTGRGRWEQKGGFLSDQKKIFDGDYYQNFSYEVQAPRTLDTYEKALKSLVHVAGMKLFGKHLHQVTLDSGVRASRVTLTSANSAESSSNSTYISTYVSQGII